MGGDWSCTIDRNAEEPHVQSSVVLDEVTKACGLLDPWRPKNEGVKQNKGLKITETRGGAARLDRFYTTKADRNKILKSFIYPREFSDHHMVTIDFMLSGAAKPRT